MAVPYIMPLGFIDQPNETGATFILTNPEDSLGLRPGNRESASSGTPCRSGIA